MELEISSLQHNFIGGDWLSNPSANRIKVNNPSTLEILGSVPDHGLEEADMAITAAARCFQEWGSASPTLREEVLRRAADLMEDLETVKQGGIPQFAQPTLDFAMLAEVAQESAPTGTIPTTSHAPQANQELQSMWLYLFIGSAIINLILLVVMLVK